MLKSTLSPESLKEQIRAEINRSVYPRKSWSHEIFKKSMQEKIQLANMKTEHHSEMCRFGYNPKKRMNVSDPVTAKIVF